MKKIYRETKNYYWEWVPIYDHYEEKEVIDYCDECGNEIGRHMEEVGINLLRYDLKKFKKTISWITAKITERLLMPTIIDSILETDDQWRMKN